MSELSVSQLLNIERDILDLKYGYEIRSQYLSFIDNSFVSIAWHSAHASLFVNTYVEEGLIPPPEEPGFDY